MYCHYSFLISCFYNDAAPTEIYTLSLHDALPISGTYRIQVSVPPEGYYVQKLIAKEAKTSGREITITGGNDVDLTAGCFRLDRKSTRLNSSHPSISYAVFCLKKKTTRIKTHYNHR